MCTEKQVAIVQQSWRTVLPVGDTFAELFYGKLFALDRGIAALFEGDLRDQGRNLKDQGRNFTAMVSVAVGSLHRPEKILYALGQLGRRHAAYGVRAEHFAVMETALLFALEHALIDVFTDELREAWRAAYAFLSNAMLEGAGEATRRSTPATTSR